MKPRNGAIVFVAEGREMKPSGLTYEKLRVIRRVVEEAGGEVPVRRLLRNNGFLLSELEEAEQAGFIEVFERKGKRGRPARLIRKVSIIHPTEFPPSRQDLEALISFRHWRFAHAYAFGEIGPGHFDFKRRAYVAYQKTFPKAESKAGAKASASRLLRRADVQAAIQWSFVQLNREFGADYLFPKTTLEIWEALHQTGSFRANWAPPQCKFRWEFEAARERASSSSE